MKKTLALLFCLLFGLSSAAMATESVTISMNHVVPKYVEQVIFTCTASGTGTLTNTPITQQELRYISGMYLYCVSAYPTSGGTAPDAADVFILTANSEDLLGSSDNSTAGNGANLIHATLQKTTIPKLNLIDQPFYPMIDGLITLQVANQGTANANFTIVLTFVK